MLSVQGFDSGPEILDIGIQVRASENLTLKTLASDLECIARRRPGRQDEALRIASVAGWETVWWEAFWLQVPADRHAECNLGLINGVF